MPDQTESIIGFTVKELFLELRADIRQVNEHLTELERRGSDQAQTAVKEIKELETRISKLEITAASSEKVSEAIKSIKTLALGVFISIGGMIGNFLLAWFRK